MTNQHPATPTPQEIDKFFMLPLSEEERLAAVFCAGADQELESCLKTLDVVWDDPANSTVEELQRAIRTARRPKPPTLKELALESLERMQDQCPHLGNAKTIRRAIEALPND